MTSSRSGTTGSELFLPASVRREMLPLFSLEELLTLEQVDAHWRRALRDAGCWSRLELRHAGDAAATDALVRRVAAAHGPDVERLELVNCAFSDALLPAVAARFSNLRVLVLSGCKSLTDAALDALVRASAQSLEELRAVKCPLLSDAALASVAAHQSRSLRRIDLSHCRLLSSAGVAALVAGGAQLRAVGLKGCPRVDGAGVAALAAGCGPALRELLVGGGGDVGDAALDALARYCGALEALDIARSNPFGSARGGVSDAALLRLVRGCRRLQRLGLRGQGRLSLAVLASLSQHCPRLQSLDIGGCRQLIQDPVALGAELRRMALLEQLSVSFARGLSDSHISSIATQCPQLKSFEVDGAQVPVVSCG